MSGTEADLPEARALARDPNSAAAHAALALALERLQRWEKAAAAYAQSLVLRPADQGTLQGLGRVLLRLNRRAELAGWIEKGIAHEPQTAMLHGMLAAQLLAFGKLDDAVRAMDEMLARDPMSGTAHAILSEMKRYRPGDPHFAALERAAANSAALPAEEQCVLRYTLGKAYDDVGRHADAFEQYIAANRIRRGLLDYDFVHALGQFARVQAAFTPELLRLRRGIGNPSERPIFIIGMMRSGTTLVEQILASHPSVHGGGETPNFQTAALQAIPGYPETVPQTSPGDLRRVAEIYLRLAGQGVRGATRLTDKTLSNDVFAGLIHIALPNARLIHVVRDAVDTCLSNFSMNFGTTYPYTCDLSELGQYYRAERRMMDYWRELLPERLFLEVRYENVVADLEGETRRMLAFCGLDWDPACLAFDKSDRAVWTASAAQVRRPLYASSVGRWRPPPAVLKPLLDGLGEYAAGDAG